MGEPFQKGSIASTESPHTVKSTGELYTAHRADAKSGLNEGSTRTNETLKALFGLGCAM